MGQFIEQLLCSIQFLSRVRKLLRGKLNAPSVGLATVLIGDIESFVSSYLSINKFYLGDCLQRNRLRTSELPDVINGVGNYYYHEQEPKFVQEILRLNRSYVPDRPKESNEHEQNTGESPGRICCSLDIPFELTASTSVDIECAPIDVILPTVRLEPPHGSWFNCHSNQYMGLQFGVLGCLQRGRIVSWGRTRI